MRMVHDPWTACSLASDLKQLNISSQVLKDIDTGLVDSNITLPYAHLRALIVRFVPGFSSSSTKGTRAQRRGTGTLVQEKTLSFISQVVARQDFPKRRGGSITADIDKKLDLGEAVVSCTTPVRMATLDSWAARLWRGA